MSGKQARFQRQTLQCGHGPKAVENGISPWWTMSTPTGFNAATARRPWRTDGRMGTSFKDLEASMRPRPEGRGERLIPPLV